MNGVVKICVSMRTDILFDTLPVASVIADFLAPAANWNQAGKGFNFRKSCLKFFNECALADALEFLHQNGLTHRDIKPQNVIYINGQPKLANLGLVAEIRPPD